MRLEAQVVEAKLKLWRTGALIQQLQALGEADGARWETRTKEAERGLEKAAIINRRLHVCCATAEGLVTRGGVEAVPGNDGEPFGGGFGCEGGAKRFHDDGNAPLS